MTAENESRNGRDGYDGRTGADALLAAITGEPLPDDARADAAFMAEHRSAAADVALLREQLGLIGQALTEPPAEAKAPEPVPLRRPSRVRRRAFTLAFGTLAVAAVASVVAGLGWLVSQGGDGLASGGSADEASSKQAGADFGSPRYLACARLVVEGDVTAVVPVPGTAQERITLRVTRFYQPDKSDDEEVTFAMEEGVVHQGEHVLVGVPQHAAAPDLWAVGEKDIAVERAWITASLSEARKLTCE
ncbi:hypothetical protein [Streptomyces regalis]|uniref:Uncharacterized protein n=1 Tax=Streptomyces regalis TaxID=68262 RepID=A0A101JST6_9ACTN|nr:hypothetical protein [Streptomyces regalis]KUL32058.1 hypothetical protein ADL12_24105 [Streptomyces regalis]